MGNIDSKIVFTIHETGHNLEYIHHIYDVCARKRTQKYIFVVPRKMQDAFNNFEWVSTENIEFDYITEREQELCNNGGIISNAYFTSKLLRKMVKNHHANEVFIITLMSLLPFVGFFVPAKVSGIIYSIYLYNWKKSSLFRKAIDVLKYLLLSKMSSFGMVFILNDQTSAKYLNSLYSTNKFRYLPDPYVPIKCGGIQSFRDTFNIPKSKCVIIHFGSIGYRKGSFDILKLIREMDDETLKDFCFVMAGRQSGEFKKYLSGCEERVRKNLLQFDEFCSFEFLASLCSEADAILAPYKECDRSSGMLGFSSQFNIPIIGPDEGLFGRLIRKHKQGVVYNPSDINDIIRCCIEARDSRMSRPSDKYCITNSVKAFQEAISECI